MPGIGDSRFDAAAIFLCSHDSNGALGLDLGSLVPGLGLHGLMTGLGMEAGQAPDLPVHLGGPVEPQRGFVLHGDDWRGDDTIDAGRLRLTGTLDVLRAMADGNGPRQALVALGYAGWGAGQLDAEMSRHGWFAAPADDTLLFDTRAPSRWAAAYRNAGVDPRFLAPAAGNA